MALERGIGVWAFTVGISLVGGLLVRPDATPYASVTEEERPCAGALQDPKTLRAVLTGIPRYARTYVILSSEELGTSITSADDPILLSLRVGVPADTPVTELARKYRWPRRVDYPGMLAAPKSIVSDVLTRKIDAAVLWAPLAGLLAMELDPTHRLNMMPIADPVPPPTGGAYESSPMSAAETVSRCREAVQGLLEAYGVAPAELLAPPILAAGVAVPTEPPPENMGEARRGWDVYQANCERCHGVDAISGGLAPDLRERVRRLSYAEFFQTVLQGRVEKGMPAWRGLLTPEDIRLVYQYLRARSLNQLGPGRPS